MTLSAKFARKQLERFKPLMTDSAIESARRGQEKIGELMTMTCKKTLSYASVTFENFESAWVIPKDDTRDGVMLYLHGGGYCCGDIAYAKGVACAHSTQNSGSGCCGSPQWRERPAPRWKRSPRWPP